MRHEAVLVYGGVGYQSLAIARAVASSGYDCRVVTRSVKNAGRIEALGARPVYGDFSDVKSLEKATQDCDAVVLTLPLVFDVDLAMAWASHVIQAAQAAKIKCLVFNASGPVPSHETGVMAVDIKVRVSKLLANSGISVIGIEPTLYMENLASPWAAPSIVLKNTLAYPLPEAQKISWTSWDDMAAFVVAALKHPEFAGRSFRVSGPQALTGGQLTQVFSARLGKPVSYYPIPLSDFSSGLNAALGEPVGTEIARLYGWFSGEGAAYLMVDDHACAQAEQALSVTPRQFSGWVNTIDWANLAKGTTT